MMVDQNIKDRLFLGGKKLSLLFFDVRQSETELIMKSLKSGTYHHQKNLCTSDLRITNGARLVRSGSGEMIIPHYPNPIPMIPVASRREVFIIYPNTISHIARCIKLCIRNNYTYPILVGVTPITLILVGEIPLRFTVIP